MGLPLKKDSPAMYNALNLRDLGCAGDQSTDDTIALQNAINTALSNNRPLWAPAGRYRFTAPINFGSIGNRNQGFTFFGDGSSNDVKSAGTSFFYTGAPTKAMFNYNIWRNGQLKDFSLMCATPRLTQYGILVPDNQPSNIRFSGIDVWYPSRAFGQEQISSANGEFYHFTDCGGSRVDEFWHNEAGQGYVHSFTHCGADLNPGGTHFNLKMESGGGGLNVFDYNGTSIHNGQPTNTTLVSATASDSVLNIIGGRLEWLTRLFYSPASSHNLRLTALFEGLQLTIDNDLGNANNRIKAFIDDQDHFDILTIRSCNLQGITGRESTNVINGYRPQPYVAWDRCLFDGLVDPRLAKVRNERFTDCEYAPWDNPSERMTLFSAGSWVDEGAD